MSHGSNDPSQGWVRVEFMCPEMLSCIVFSTGRRQTGQILVAPMSSAHPVEVGVDGFLLLLNRVAAGADGVA